MTKSSDGLFFGTHVGTKHKSQFLTQGSSIHDLSLLLPIISFPLFSIFWLLFVPHKFSLSITFRKTFLERLVWFRKQPMCSVPVQRPAIVLVALHCTFGFDCFSLTTLSQTVNSMKIKTLPTSFSSFLRKPCFYSGLYSFCMQSTGAHCFPLIDHGMDVIV